ncbi:hypothetical protein LA76x_3188 [Lysobacter antibioticus]|uniref:Uncharacterized protein n=1 Tax=Lysobacter antibioticus TaxID=84531 RepID=A0A0S2FCS8_LYSAN|nr:hypothetical protein LA76x_3188 [Lysobacter antibioticus]
MQETATRIQFSQAFAQMRNHPEARAFSECGAVSRWQK